MDELAGTENRLAVERMRYNERVQEYNTARRQFPGNVTAKMFGFKEYPFFEVPPEAKQVPKVDFKKSIMNGLLPWERLLWSSRPWRLTRRIAGERYLLTDFRLLRVTGRGRRGNRARRCRRHSTNRVGAPTACSAPRRSSCTRAGGARHPSS